MRGSFSINGKDTFATWGVVLAERSIEQFIAPAPMKDYITNDSAVENGVQVLTSASALPKIGSQSITLEVNIIASNNADFRTKLAAFRTVLQGCVLDIRIPDHTTEVFHCLYQSCTQFSDYDGRVAKFSLRLLEPNPANRS